MSRHRAGESLAACRREVEEELGIAPRIGPLLVIDWAPSEAEGDKVLYVFDGGQLTARRPLSPIHLGVDVRGAPCIGDAP